MVFAEEYPWCERVRNWKLRRKDSAFRFLSSRPLADAPHPQPSLSRCLDAVYASDYILMVFQTQQSAYESSLSFVNFLRDRKKESDLSFELVGAVPVLIKKSGRVDKQILDMSKSAFSEALFENQIYQRERIKKFAADGIKDKDMHDKKVIHMFNKVYEELVSRIKLIEEE